MINKLWIQGIIKRFIKFAVSLYKITIKIKTKIKVNIKINIYEDKKRKYEQRNGWLKYWIRRQEVSTDNARTQQPQRYECDERELEKLIMWDKSKKGKRSEVDI